jgi:tetratricopeptide (TPR) repeat protein
VAKGERVIAFRSGVLRVFATAFLISVVSYVFVHAQNPATVESLQAGIARIKAADFEAAITMLNHVVTRASLDENGLVARAHLYKAEAYLGMGQPDYARTSVVLGLDADPAIAVDTLDVSPVLKALIGELRSTSDADPETAARSAEASGRYQDALAAYLRAFRALPDPAPIADSQRLRERIITVVRRLEPKPAIPQDARAHFAKAEDLLQAERLLGSPGPGPSEAAAVQLRLAITSAPWWGEATFRLATILQRLQRFDEAAANLTLYRLADPDGFAAAVAAKSEPVAARAPIAAATPAPAVAVAPVAIPASLYVYWPRQARGGTQKVLCDGFHVADLEDRHFVLLRVKPGPHTVTVGNREFPLSLEAGQAYYVRAYIGGYPARRMARLVAAAEGAPEVNDKDMNPNERQRTFNSECNGGAADRPRVAPRLGPRF